MIVYQSDKAGFNDDFLAGNIEEVIQERFRKILHQRVAKNEVQSWKNSLHYMNTVLQDREIPEDAGISIETKIPQTSKRIDFIITGQDKEKKDHVVIIELKQWSSAVLTEMDAVVRTRFEHGFADVNHPSYQAWSYAALLEGYNEAIYNGDINLNPCAFLHNYKMDDVIRHPFYKEHLDKAPVFLKTEIRQLQDFIRQFVRYGDRNKILYKIENGRIRPSKSLADSLAKMLVGNREFVMIDEQKLVYEKVMNAAAKSDRKGKKHVIIVEGGPGTGKSVVAINLLVNLTGKEKNVQYVTKNAAPRAVYASKLTGTIKKTEYENMFKSSGAYINTKPNTFDVLVVDEAHRLNDKSGLYGNLGENQVKEIIKASMTSVFFVDEDQRVTLKDIGSKEEIQKWAERSGAEIEELKLESQFRCNGSDGYLSWLDHTLQIRRTANPTLEGINYDFKIFSDPNSLRKEIEKKNKPGNKARMVAGYCWEWKSKKNSKLKDVIIPEFNFEMTWNLTKDGSLWIMSPDSVNEIGCIHTCQGLELDYIGVIVGPDLLVRKGEIKVDPGKRAKSDASIKGYKRLIDNDPVNAKKLLKGIILNTYRTLMTRGMKGCYVYFCDKEAEEFFRENLAITHVG
ncbi:MAG TPA: DUF2075 domain-containing protein [Bacteroidia bacterium]|nr:DUF2075 domain-containing protein [Bacteroidia bacterium]